MAKPLPLLFAASLLAASTLSSIAIAGTVSDKVKEAMQSEQRSDKDKERDRNRSPVETLEFFGIKDMFEGCRVCLLTAFDELAAGVINLSMQGVVKMLGAHKLGYPLIRAIVLENSAQQTHLRLEVIRRLPIAWAVIDLAVMGAGIHVEDLFVVWV